MDGPQKHFYVYGAEIFAIPIAKLLGEGGNSTADVQLLLMQAIYGRIRHYTSCCLHVGR